MSVPLFEIEELHVSTAASDLRPGREIIDGLSLTVGVGEAHALIGPPGSGKSTLAAALLGSPALDVTGGRIRLRGDDITDWGTDVRAKAGLFLTWQHPHELAGVSMLGLLRQALGARRGTEISVIELRRSLLDWMEKLDLDPDFLDRHVNHASTPAEQRLSELLQVAVLEPEMAVLDDCGSGADPDPPPRFATGLQTVRAQRPALGTLTVTRHPRLLDLVPSDHVHVLVGGRIVATGGTELVHRIKTDGYESFT